MLCKSAFISPKRLTERFFIFYRKFVSFFFSVGVIKTYVYHLAGRNESTRYEESKKYFNKLNGI